MNSPTISNKDVCTSPFVFTIVSEKLVTGYRKLPMSSGGRSQISSSSVAAVVVAPDKFFVAFLRVCFFTGFSVGHGDFFGRPRLVATIAVV
jgi:hypothetical protein